MWSSKVPCQHTIIGPMMVLIGSWSALVCAVGPMSWLSCRTGSAQAIATKLDFQCNYRYAYRDLMSRLEQPVGGFCPSGICVWANVYVCICHSHDRKKIFLASKKVFIIRLKGAIWDFVQSLFCPTKCLLTWPRCNSVHIKCNTLPHKESTNMAKVQQCADQVQHIAPPSFYSHGHDATVHIKCNTLGTYLVPLSAHGQLSDWF